MEKFIIEGGSPLQGIVTPGGNKNAALPLLAACLLTEEPVVLHNVPRIRDVSELDPVSLVAFEKVVMSKGAVQKLGERLA